MNSKKLQSIKFQNVSVSNTRFQDRSDIENLLLGIRVRVLIDPGAEPL